MKASEFELMAQQSDHWWYKERSAYLKEALDEVVGKNERPLCLLDLACALGGNYSLLRRYGKPVGLDISAIAISSGMAKGMEMVQADAQILPFADESLDIVVALDVFEHLAQDHQGLSECLRILKPGGWLIYNLPACPILFSDHDRSFHHYRRYTKTALLEKLVGAGFENKFVTYWSFFLFPAVFAVRCIVQKVLHAFNRSQGSSSDFKYPIPKAVLGGMGALARFEHWLIQRGVILPWGVSLFGRAQKPAG